jgi:hypothetical protein
MKFELKFFSFLLSIVFLAGCTKLVKESDLSNAHYPPEPKKELVDSFIKDHLNSVLRDPKSLILKCSKTRKGWARQYRSSSPEFGWVTPCMVNAKNGLGGYTGSKLYVYLYSTSGFKYLDGTLFRGFDEHVGYVK